MISVILDIQRKTNLSEQEAWWMLQHITKKTKEQLILLSPDKLSELEQTTINSWIAQLTKESIPLAYLLGTVPFLDLTIAVEPPILIPRHETEEWINYVIQNIHPYKQEISQILDIGTGTGCIALSLAKHFPQAHITATDINPKALCLAQHNAKLNNITNISFVESDLFEKVPTSKFDLIVSNPPYIDPKHTKTIMPQVGQWEDHKALFADDHGLHIVQQLLTQAHDYIKNNPQLPFQLVIEFDHEQAATLKNIASNLQWITKLQKDLFNNYRVGFFKKDINCKNIY